METKKRNIKIGLVVGIISVLVYVFFLVIGAEWLVKTGNGIEGLFGYCSDFDVEKFREGIKTIASGIFVSALVAVMFYLQEYHKMKSDLINEIIALSRDICKKFNIIPSFPSYGEEAELKKNYYMEYKRNNRLNEAVNKTRKLCENLKNKPNTKRIIKELENKTIKMEKDITDKAELKLTSFWKKNNKEKEWINESLLFLANEYDKLIQNSINCYLEILSIDLNPLRNAVTTFNYTHPFSKKIRKKMKTELKDKNIIGDLENIEYSAEDISNRILSIFERAIKLVGYVFEKNCIDIDHTNNELAINAVIELQRTFIDSTDAVIILDEKKKSEKKYRGDYKIMQYFMENLFSILLLELGNKYKYLPKNIFVRPAKRYSRGTFLNTVILHNEEILDMLYIYR